LVSTAAACVSFREKEVQRRRIRTPPRSVHLSIAISKSRGGIVFAKHRPVVSEMGSTSWVVMKGWFRVALIVYFGEMRSALKHDNLRIMCLNSVKSRSPSSVVDLLAVKGARMELAVDSGIQSGGGGRKERSGIAKPSRDPWNPDL